MKVYNDFNTSVVRALGEIDPKWRDYKGTIICGTHSPRREEFLIQEIEEAREKGTPFLGICFGHQLAWIEHNRTVLGIKDATSEEWGGEGTFVVVKRPEMKVGLHEGESWWSNYACTQDEWEKPENFFTAPYHPEYQSYVGHPHPLLVDFLKYAKKYEMAM